ncbi:MAG TPA: LCP family protein [Candidatus Scubalenecus merdavium]|uniref:LCP family protein n=1 Tax=Candidatus Scybalenecus merdavium TaxID=2840939 RepID=A0A9D1SPC9_9FIRM|nr:LCP family protein [Candidatus Scubalenecus merdavium]
MQVSMDTLEMLYDMDIDYYFRINFTGFEKIVDVLGGIEVYSDTAFDSRGAHFEQGINHLNGEEALIYCRERYAYADGDRHRGQNQMDVIKAIAEKAVSPSILKNYLSVLDSLQDYMETSVPYDLIAQVVQDQLSGNPQWDITSYSVDGTAIMRFRIP